MSEIDKAVTNVNTFRALQHISGMKAKAVPKTAKNGKRFTEAVKDHKVIFHVKGELVNPSHPDTWFPTRFPSRVTNSVQNTGLGLKAKPSRTVLVGKRDFSDKRRAKLASKGDALPDGSFPIPDKDALRRARMSIGRSKDPAAARALIDRRAKELGVSMKGSDINKSAFGVEHEGIAKANNKRAQQVENAGTAAAVGGPLAGAGLAFHSGKHINEMKEHNIAAGGWHSKGFESWANEERVAGIKAGAKASKELGRAGALGAAGVGLGLGAKAVALHMKKKNR